MHGAHVTAYRPWGHQELLWTSGKSHFESGKAIRGGIPICFPWFGPHPHDVSQPAHGFARTATFQLDGIQEQPSGETELSFSLSRESDGKWPYAVRVEHIITVGATLSCRLRVTNMASEPFTFEMALHSYFDVADIHQIRIRGLENQPFLNQLDGTQQQASDPIKFESETDRIYTHAGTAWIDDPLANRSICISKRHSGSTVVWNPWKDKARRMPDFGDEEWRSMVCVETANIGTHAVRLPSGASHQTELTIAAMRL
jgi:glucose-6-phosphate 1-epimerase